MDKETIDRVDQIIAEKGKSADQVIPVLQALQSEFNYLSGDVLKRVCQNTDITPARIQGVSTFYSRFRHKPVGKHIIKVCIGTACHVKGAGRIFEVFKRTLNIPEQEDTDADGLFTVEEVACLGCCAIAPVVQIDQVIYGLVESGKVADILDDFLSKENTTPDKEIRTLSEKGLPQGEIRIGLDSCCVAGGNLKVKEELDKVLQKSKINVAVKQVGCVGVCNQVPMMEIHKPGEDTVYYTRIKIHEVREIVQRHFKSVKLLDRVQNRFHHSVERYVFRDIPESARPFLADEVDSPIYEYNKGQVNIATEYLGKMMPSDIDEYKRFEGFEALKDCLTGRTPDEIIDELEVSGLRGRGGAGFPAAKKWRMVNRAASKTKYVICNGDEGDPGAFMDRMLLESFPFRVLEGMIIAAYAVGAGEGIFYIRSEYPLSVKRIREAIARCEQEGLLGENILGTSFSFKVKVFEGAGAFVCGEETALIASLEGRRGVPLMRPPYPAEKGLWNQPTLINNTETLSLVPWIMRNGAGRFNKIGTASSPGTKVFALAGKINRGGLIEVPMGITIRKIVEEIGGGIPNGKRFKAVLIGGPSGGCIPASMADTPIDYEALSGAGAMMGSGGLVVLDETDCMVDIARYFLAFTRDESCGKCTFCRIGTRRMLDLLDKISSGKGRPEDLDTLEQLAVNVKKSSLCGLGQTAPNPVLTTLRYFREEYEAHINGVCPAGKCKDLITYEITSDCIGCTNCVQRCPADAIISRPYQRHEIDPQKCIRCDVCKQICPENAVIIR
ncbi:4Fe-4S dicluster domain-containing protein [Marinilabiliaceae bacterium JC017]|nr:4Fe-4S dicluster domain-containing protein [Marinilabiliaceae bacterium JC017]